MNGLVSTDGGRSGSQGLSPLRTPSAHNKAYAGVPQDDPSVMDSVGEQIADELARRNMAVHIMGVFESNRMLRESNGVDIDLMKRLRQMNGEYEPEDLAEIVQKGQPDAYLNISAHKQRTLVAWLTEFFADGDKSFYIKPTPVPEMSDEVVATAVERTLRDWVAELADTGQAPLPEVVFEYATLMRERVQREVEDEAKLRAANMDRRLKDDFVEGRWGREMDALIGYLATYGTAGLRAPVIRIRKTPVYARGKYGKRVEDRTRLVREAEAISPFDLFPSNGAVTAQDGDLCIRVRYSPKELRRLVKTPCYFGDNIIELLEQGGSTGIPLRVSSDTERERLEKKSAAMLRERKTLEGVEYWGEVSGEMLVGMGITRTPDKDPVKGDEWYEVNAIVIGSKVIYCRVLDNDDERPIDIAHVYRKPGSFWGEGPLQVIDHIQRLCNATTRNLLVNMGFASGPQAVMDDASRLHPMDDGRARPNKTWAFTNAGNQASQPIRFWNIPSIARELIDIFTFYMRLADEITGIPAFANGTDAAVGAARTATGLSMLFGAANRGIKKIVANMDEVLRSCLLRLYWWHMRYNTDESIKGDIRVEVCGVRQFSMREQLAQKHLQLLQVTSQDPRVQQLQTPEELARLLREIAVGFELDPDSLAPSEEELSRRMERARAEAQAQMQADQAVLAEQAQAQAQQQQQGGGMGQIPQEQPQSIRPQQPARARVEAA